MISGAQALNVVKCGPGKLTLAPATAPNTYGGKTTVYGGTLALATAAQGPVLTGGGAQIEAGLLSLLNSSPALDSTVDTLMKASYAGGAWNVGQFQSVAAPAAGMTLGWIETGTQVDVKIAVVGDVNLDGVVNFDDYSLVCLNYGLTGTAAIWAAGDINYDGVVNFDDYSLVCLNYGQSVPPALDPAPLGGAASGGHTAVPEPGTLALLGCGLLGLLAYAWRKRK